MASDAAQPILRGIDDARLLVDALPVAAVTIFDTEMRYVAVGGTGKAALGLTREQLEGHAFRDLFETRNRTRARLEPLLAAALRGETTEHDLQYGELTLQLTTGPYRDATGAIVGGIHVFQDVSRAREQERSLRRAEEQFRTAFDNAPIGVALVGTDGGWLRVNAALCDLVGHDEEALLATTFQDITHPDDLDADLALVGELLAGHIRTYQLEKRYIRADGEVVWALLSVSLVRDDDGTPLHFVSQLQDITERKAEEAGLRHRAERDPLTGLANRLTFDAGVIRQIERSARYGEEASVLVIDLDDFKAINDAHGHAAGDQALRQVARAIERRLRTTDLAARLGGDEFAVLLPRTDAAAASIVAHAIVEEVASERIITGEYELRVAASVGVAGLGSQDHTLDEADAAMYLAKRDGGNRVVHVSA
jgi:diguanylate cyclase (GGDEF)-like protein/PAS domain S-box-containing protein